MYNIYLGGNRGEEGEEEKEKEEEEEEEEEEVFCSAAVGPHSLGVHTRLFPPGGEEEKGHSLSTPSPPSHTHPPPSEKTF